MPLTYKFVELSVVTEETLEQAVNEWVRRGWTFDGVRFVTTDASRRPAMAFVSFVRQVAAEAEGGWLRSLEALSHDDGWRPEPMSDEGEPAPRRPHHYELGELDLGDDDGGAAALAVDVATATSGRAGATAQTSTGRTLVSVEASAPAPPPAAKPAAAAPAKPASAARPPRSRPARARPPGRRPR